MKSSSLASARILVADDDNALRHALATILKNCGHKLTSLDNGADALQALRRDTFDLAILDIWMPRMSGLEVLSHLRNLETKPRVIVMTSDDTPETLLRAVREEAYDYIAKPFPPQSIVACVERALHKDAEPPIEILCAQPHWLELLAPCTRTSAERIEGNCTAVAVPAQRTPRTSALKSDVFIFLFIGCFLSVQLLHSWQRQPTGGISLDQFPAACCERTIALCVISAPVQSHA